MFKCFYFCIVIAFFSLSLSGQVQPIDYKIMYDFVYTLDTNRIQYSQPVEFILLHASGESRFHAVNKQYNDSMSNVYKKSHLGLKLAKTQEEMQKQVDQYMVEMRKWKKSVDVDFVIQKDFDLKKIRNVLNYAFPPQHMETDMVLNWNLTTEKDTILVIPCSVGTIQYGGRVYKAHYSDQIPIPDGPYVFCGLPGLILKITDDKGWYRFIVKEIDINPDIKVFWKLDYINDKSEIISRKQFVEYSESFMNNPKLPGINNLSAEYLLEKKRQFSDNFYMILEQ